MCGRYNLVSPTSQIIEEFELFSQLEEITANYNVAPATDVPVIRNEKGQPILTHMRWQFIPSGARAKNEKMPFIINARGETIEKKVSFKEAFKYRRCIIPANAFYEWKKLSGRKIPYLIKKKNDTLLGLAGIYSRSTDEIGNVIETMAIITTKPNTLMNDIHDRMPVILEKGDYSTWLDEKNTDQAALKKLLVPCAAEILVAHPISTRVNKVANNDADLLKEVNEGDIPGQIDLF